MTDPVKIKLSDELLGAVEEMASEATPHVVVEEIGWSSVTISIEFYNDETKVAEVQDITMREGDQLKLNGTTYSPTIKQK